MKKNKTLLTIAIIIVLIGIIKFLFSINYNESIKEISNYQIQNSGRIEMGKIIVGSNHMNGNIEAIVFPDQFVENGKEEKIDYIYMRFNPKWFEEHLSPFLKKKQKTMDRNLLQEVKRIHNQNFRFAGHFNKIPLVSDEKMFILIQKANGKQEKLIYDIENKSELSSAVAKGIN